MGINAYYNQFRDDEDLFPHHDFNYDEEMCDADFESSGSKIPDDDMESFDCPGCFGRGCNSCLGLEW